MREKEETMPRDSGEGPSGLLPPASIEDLLRSLDLASATSRDKKVVTAQGENDDQVSLSGGAGPTHPCSSSSNREPTDEEILSNEMIKNLDTGEEIPLIQAVENLPSGIHPLTLHIMKRTKEYSTNDVHQSDDDKAAQTDTDGSKLTQQFKKTVAKSVKGAKHLAEKCGDKVVTMVKSVRSDTFQSQRPQQQQSEDDDDGKVEYPVTYTDGGKFKQKTTQMKNFIGKSVEKAKHLTEKYGEKAINKVKGFRDDAAQSPQEQEQYQDDQEHQDEHEEEQEKEQQHTDDNDHKAVVPLTDTDGGKLKQKTTTVRKFIGKSVKKAKHLTEKYGERAINKVKSFRDDAAQSTQEPKQYQKQEEHDEQYEQEEQQHTHGEEQDEQYEEEGQQHIHGDDHGVESPVTDTDGGKLKQKTTTVKKFIGKSVKKAKHLTEKFGEKAINKMKSFRDDAAQSPQEQDIEEHEEEQQQSDDDDQAEVSATDSDGGKLQSEKSAGKPGNKHLAEEYEQKSVNKVKRVHDDAAQSGDDEEQEQRQSDNDDKAVALVTDTDGGKLKPKSTPLKMFMEKSVTSAKHLAEKYGEKSAVNTAQLKDFLGRSMKGAKQLAEKYGEKAVSKVKSVHEVFHPDQEDEEKRPYVGPAKFKASHSFEGPFKFDQMKVIQDLSGVHTGAVWAMKFSLCGRLLATAGHDKMVRIWVLKTAFDHFNNMRTNNNTEGCVSPSPSQKSSCLSKSDLEIVACTPEDPDTEERNAPFCQAPFCEYKGHTSHILDLSWSKDYLLLSSSMDKTVRLWHISRRECQWCFPHKDIVSAIAFHPREQRFFLSGSLDGKLRMWNIIDKKVELWNEVDSQKSQFITAANFCETGKYAIVGTLDGRCILYDSENLKYHTQILVRSTRGRNTVGHKITGIEPLPGENKILVTSNDSRIRLYDLRDMSLSMKYKGYANSSTRQIKASFSHDYSFIVSGSEDKYVYIWSTYHNSRKLTSVRRDRNDFWEGIKAHNIVVTSAIFAPHPGLIVPQEAESKSTYSKDSETVTSGALETTDHTEVLVSADYTGAIKVFINVKGREVTLKQDTWDTEVPEQEGRTLQLVPSGGTGSAE